MRIVELVLDEDQENTGIEAISIVDNPAIEADFIALKAEEVRLAEVSKEKRILMGALLIPNKPIYRMSEDGEYYIYFSKETVEKASQMYLRNGNQNNATLEHQHQLQGLTLVESWIIEDEVHDKSKKYGLNLPVGTWMGSMKVESDDVWADLKKKGGFSIEGYFADKMQKLKTIKPKMNKEQKEAEVLLSKIISIVKGERVDLSLVDDAKKILNELTDLKNGFGEESRSIISAQSRLSKKIKEVKSKLNPAQKIIDNYESQLKDLGIDKSPPIISNMKKMISEIKKDTSRFEKDFL
mgnify:FL=1|tara:strand:+ start:487 stop:1374 length:888 start_codon:yes stop_codon:yes gene_type:complete